MDQELGEEEETVEGCVVRTNLGGGQLVPPGYGHWHTPATPVALCPLYWGASWTILQQGEVLTRPPLLSPLSRRLLL